MRWNKNIKNGLVIITNTFVLYTFTCLSFKVVNNLHQKNAISNYNSNTIRATYPNYEKENIKYVVKIFEDFATNEFLRENILDFQFITSNRTKEELVWKIVRNTTVLNRFIPFYVKDLFKEEVIFLCNEFNY